MTIYAVQTWLEGKQEWMTILRHTPTGWVEDVHNTLDAARIRFMFLSEHADEGVRLRIAIRECVYKEVV